MHARTHAASRRALSRWFPLVRWKQGNRDVRPATGENPRARRAAKIGSVSAPVSALFFNLVTLVTLACREKRGDAKASARVRVFPLFMFFPLGFRPPRRHRRRNVPISFVEESPGTRVAIEIVLHFCTLTKVSHRNDTFPALFEHSGKRGVARQSADNESA